MLSLITSCMRSGATMRASTCCYCLRPTNPHHRTTTPLGLTIGAVRGMAGGSRNRTLHSPKLHKNQKIRLILRYWDQWFLGGSTTTTSRISPMSTSDRKPRRQIRWPLKRLNFKTILFSEMFRGWTKEKDILEAILQSKGRYYVEEMEDPPPSSPENKRKRQRGSLRRLGPQKEGPPMHYFVCLDETHPDNTDEERLERVRTKIATRETKAQRMLGRYKTEGVVEDPPPPTTTTTADDATTTSSSGNNNNNNNSVVDTLWRDYIYKKVGSKKRPKLVRFKTLAFEIGARLRQRAGGRSR